MNKYYLDVAATTKPDKEVADVMYDTMLNHYGNPSSTHELGQDAKHIVEDVRDQIAEDIGCEPHEIIFTSGACESNSLALYGTGVKSIVTSHLEHKSIEEITNSGYFNTIIYIPVASTGFINHDILKDAINVLPKCLTSIQYANSEIGTIQNIPAIANLVHSNNNILHVDATQIYGERNINVKDEGIDMMSVSAQKWGGPKGIGFLYCRDGIKLMSIIKGSQEDYRRGGTYNTPAIAGMGKALEITRKNQKVMNEKIRDNRDDLAECLFHIPGIRLIGPSLFGNRLYNNLSICIDGVKASDLVTMASMYGVYISAGSACSSGEATPSSTLKAVGLSDKDALSTIRLTVDGLLDMMEIAHIGNILKHIIEMIRKS